MTAARASLARAETTFRSEAGLADLQEGLALLDTIALDPTSRHRAIALNLFATYSTKICESVRALVDSDPPLPEPVLEHLFRVLLTFDSSEFELPDYVRTLKIRVVKRLIDLYYEGHSPDEKEAALRQLTAIAGDET